jgi:hypothetical protein
MFSALQWEMEKHENHTLVGRIHVLRLCWFLIPGLPISSHDNAE